MERHDCDTCLSAGSVNQWGICEICGEEFEETVSFGDWSKISFGPMRERGEAMASTTVTGESISEVGQTAA